MIETSTSTSFKGNPLNPQVNHVICYVGKASVSLDESGVAERERNMGTDSRGRLGVMLEAAR